MKQSGIATNEAILQRIEALGGGSVWEPEMLIVSLIDAAVSDDEAAVLLGLTGVQQIALDASRLSFAVLCSIARIAWLQSLVLSRANLSDGQQHEVAQLVPELVLVTGEG